MSDTGRTRRVGFSHMNFFHSLYAWQREWDARQRIDRAVAQMLKLGANAWRPWIHWSVVEPVIGQPLLRRADVTEQRVAEYAADERLGWADYDYMVAACEAAGIELHLVLGGGYTFGLPCFEHPTSGLKFLPAIVGDEHYLAHLSLHARAVVRRYRGRVRLWQLENELNAAGETETFARWRQGGRWWDWSFLSALLRTLHDAARQEDPRALLSHNFQCDYRRLPGLWDWRRDVRRWRDLLDIVGVDRYPDYMLGRWSRGPVVARCVERALDAAQGRPVMVLEAGYPTAPSWRGFSEQGQVRYIESAVAASLEAGASGFYYYNLVSPELSMRWFQGESLVERIEPHWGLIRAGGEPKPGFAAFKLACSSLG